MAKPLGKADKNQAGAERRAGRESATPGTPAEARAQTPSTSPAPEAPAGPRTFEEVLGIADLQQASANYEDSMRTYREALDLPGVGDLEKARAYKGIGACLERIGRWKESLNVLEEAAAYARAAQDDAELGRIEIKLGKIHIGQGSIETALACGERALGLIDAAADPSSRGFALNLLGSAHNRQGNLDASADCFEQALSAFKSAGDIRSLALAYNNLGLIYKERCDWTRALEYLQVASSLQAIEGDYPQRRAGRHNLGLVFFKMGRLDRARECFTEAQELSRSVNDPLGVIRALLGNAGVDLVQRRHDQALEELEQVLELCSDEQYPRETALTYRSLGQLHQARGTLNRARRCFEVSWRKAVEISQEGDLARELLRLRALLALEQKRGDEALNLARRAEELSARQDDRMETALARATLGQVLVSQGDASGYAHLKDAQGLLRRLASPLPLVQALVTEGRLRLAARADLTRAESVLREARGLLENLDLAELELETLVLLGKVAGAGSDLDRSTEYLDQARKLAVAVSDVSLRGLLEDAQNELESRLVDSSIHHLGAYRTAGRLEEIIESQRPFAAKSADILELLAAALEADGAALVVPGSSIAPSTHRIGTATAAVLARVLGAHGSERPEIILDATTSTRKPWVEIAASRNASSLLVVPIYSNGPTAYLYLDRLADGHRSAFGPSHLNLCLALVPELATLLDRAESETAVHDGDDSIQRRIYLADVVTQCPDMVSILRLVEKVSRTDLTVLLQGETGTGKTLIARAIHLTSDRAEGPFVTVDCAALPENLLESELFGYMKGAFTGAANDKKGLFEEADGGTIFLDEIGKAGLGVQRRLLHLLDRGEVRPVGSTSYRKLNVRVICATSKANILEEGIDGPFIKDLFYRLNDIIIKVPALRDRPEDIPLLSEYFLETFNSQTGSQVPGFSRAAMQRLVRFSWPGNVRELEKAVRRAGILAEEGETIGVDLLPTEIINETETGMAVTHSQESGLRGTVEEMERRMVLEALEKNDWNKTRAAQALGLSRKGLKNKIARYELERGAS